jgi:hypothetical protein
LGTSSRVLQAWRAKLLVVLFALKQRTRQTQLVPENDRESDRDDGPENDRDVITKAPKGQRSARFAAKVALGWPLPSSPPLRSFFFSAGGDQGGLLVFLSAWSVRLFSIASKSIASF